MPDLLALQKAIDKFNDHSIPALTEAIQKLVDHADLKLDEDAKQLFVNLNQTLGTLMGDVYQVKKELIDEAHGLIDRLDGATITIKLPERKP